MCSSKKTIKKNKMSMLEMSCWNRQTGAGDEGVSQPNTATTQDPGRRFPFVFLVFYLFSVESSQRESINYRRLPPPLALLLFLCLCLFCASLGASPLPALPLKSGSQKATQGRWYGAGTMPAAHTATCPTESTATCDWLDFFQMKMPLISKFGSCCVIWYRPPLP